MLNFALPIVVRRALIALSLATWLFGGAWHGAMQVKAAMGEEVCTASGTKRLTGRSPAQPGSLAGKACTQCAAFSAPAVAVSEPSGPIVALLATLSPVAMPDGATVPSSHLADLASRAPPTT